MQFQLRFSEERHRIISVIHYFALPSLILGTAINFLGGGGGVVQFSAAQNVSHL